MHSFEGLEIPRDSVGIHWFGQSSFAFKDSSGTIVMVDPFFPRNRPDEEYIHPVAPLDEATFKIDYVLLTHDHGDHTCTELLLRIYEAFPAVRYVGPHESIDRLLEIGFPKSLLSTIAAGDSAQLGRMTAHAVWSKPPDGVPADGIPIPDVTHLGYVLEIGAIRVYVSGDLFNTAAKHEEFLDPILQLQPDLGLLTVHPTEGEFPYFDGSVEMAAKLRLKYVMPAHYGCFVKRTYNPDEWASLFPEGRTIPIVIPYNTSVVFHL